MFRALPALAVSLALGAASVVPLAARADEIDRVVAVIRSSASSEARIITSTRLEDETRILLVSRGGVLAGAEGLDDSALASGLEWIVDETLLMDEAARLRVLDDDGGSEDADELPRFRSRFERASDYRAFLDRWNLTEEEVGTVLKRMARVKRYLDTRVSHVAQVSESEVTAWLDAHGAGAAARDRAMARARLIQERIAAEVKALVRDLRSRAEVKFLTRFGGAAPRHEGR